MLVIIFNGSGSANTDFRFASPRLTKVSIIACASRRIIGSNRRSRRGTKKEETLARNRS